MKMIRHKTVDQKFNFAIIVFSFMSYTVQGPTLHGIYSNLVVMAVGGVFDVLAGKIARAPKLVQQFGFEWLWRLFKEPWRWRRQLSLLQFILLILRKKK